MLPCGILEADYRGNIIAAFTERSRLNNFVNPFRLPTVANNVAGSSQAGIEQVLDTGIKH